MKFKLSKKIIISLLPCYLLIFTIPLLFLDSAPNFLTENRLSYPVALISIIIYLVFILPVDFLLPDFVGLGLARETGGGFFNFIIVNPWGMIVLALLYSGVFYLIISFLEFLYLGYKKNK
jgi:hypothetical protein